MLKRIIIENFRSIKKIDIELSALNAFIGANNSGKSNIMLALNLVLGETYPTLRSFTDQDFFNYEKTNPIIIRVQFDKSLQCNANIHGFSLVCDGKDVQYLALVATGEVAKYASGGREIRVSSEMKDEVTLMYLDIDRQSSQQLRATQWTLYGKILKTIEKSIGADKKKQFADSVQQAFNANIHPSLIEAEDILKKYVADQTGLDLAIRLSVLDPVETIKNLRPYLKEASSPHEFDAEDMGAGTQSALAVAIARAYAEIVKKPLVMAIEEPELYLHPHGCRHFYRLLKELSEKGVQIIYTTHETSFVNVAEYQSINLVKKESNKTAVKTGFGKKLSSSGNDLKLISKFNDEVNELFFAQGVILVEGYEDKIACRLALEKHNCEIDKKGISIIECGGITAVPSFCEVLKFFDIPLYALVDEDPGNKLTATIITKLQSLIGKERVLLQSPNLESLFGLTQGTKMSKYEWLAFLPTWFDKNEPPKIYSSFFKKD